MSKPLLKKKKSHHSLNKLSVSSSSEEKDSIEEVIELTEPYGGGGMSGLSMSHSIAGYSPISHVDSGSDTDQLSLSADSTILYGSSLRNQIITVAATLAPHGGVELLVSNVRHPSNILGDTKKNSQGDHVTAYVSFLEMICAVVDEEAIEEIPDRIAEIAKCVLSEHVHAEFQEQLNQFKKSQEKHISREKRKRLTKALRVVADKIQSEELNASILPEETLAILVEYIDDEKIRELKDAIKDGAKLLLIRAINKLGGKFLEKIQKEPAIAFPKVPKSDQTLEEKEEARTEGARVKSACYGLKSIGRLITLKQSFENIDKIGEAKADVGDVDELVNFTEDLVVKNSTLKSGLKVITEDSKKLKKLISDIEAAKNSGKFKKLISSLKELVEEFMGNYPKELGKGNKTAVKAGQLFGHIYDFKCDRHSKVGYGIEIDNLLYHVTAKHIVIMFTAFNSLKKLNTKIRRRIINTFIGDSVLKNEGWSKFKILADTGDGKMKDVNLNIKILRQKIEKIAELGGLDGRNFKMLPPLHSSADEEEVYMKAADIEDSVKTGPIVLTSKI